MYNDLSLPPAYIEGHVRKDGWDQPLRPLRLFQPLFVWGHYYVDTVHVTVYK
jgi:hypothetical protein